MKCSTSTFWHCVLRANSRWPACMISEPSHAAPATCHKIMERQSRSFDIETPYVLRAKPCQNWLSTTHEHTCERKDTRVNALALPIFSRAPFARSHFSAFCPLPSARFTAHCLLPPMLFTAGCLLPAARCEWLRSVARSFRMYRPAELWPPRLLPPAFSKDLSRYGIQPLYQA